MQTRDDSRFPGENFSVIRLRRNILASSDIGVMFVNRDGTGSGIGSDYSRSYGVDGNLRLFSGRMLVNSYVAATQSPGTTGSQRAGALEVAWRDPLWNSSFLLKSVGEAFSPKVGFVRRRGVRQGFATLGVHPQPNLSWVREINPYVDLDVYSDMDWELESREITPGLGVSFSDSGLLTLEYVTRYERLTETTSIAGGTVGAGEYTFGSLGASYRSDGGRRLSGSVQIASGDFFDGTRTSFGGSVTLRPTVHWYVQGSVQRNRLTLGGEEIDANLFGGRLRYARSTRAFFSAFIQYNQAAEELLTNVRLNLIHAPLSDLFLVYSDRRDRGPSTEGSRVLDRALTLKVTKLLAF